MTDVLDSPLGTVTGGDMRAFIEGVLREQQGNAVLALVGGRLSTGKPVINRATWFQYPAQLPEMVAFAEAHADEDVYISPVVYGEARDARGKPRRSAENALTSATIYMDSDSCLPEKFRLRPSIHVQTSQHHGQDYWVLPSPIPASEAAEIAHRITTAHKKDGSDPTGWSANKYLRLPTVNLSYDEPWPITWHETGELYDPLDISGAYDDIVLDAVPVAATMPTPAPKPSSVPAQPVVAEVPELIPAEQLAPLYNRIPATNTRLADLLQHEPKAGDAGWRSEQRWALLLELLRAGFDVRETLSLSWHAMASGKWHDDPRGINGLWYELQKARVQVETETGVHTTPAERAKPKARAPKVISELERRTMPPRRDFIDQYLHWADTRVPVLNAPLHEINAWTILSIAFAESGYVWKPSGPLSVNLYSVSIAESSSGKTEASRLMRGVIAQLFPRDNPAIGADHSRNALVEILLGRDGKVAFAASEEADETFRTQRDSPWAQGMQQAWTEVYDGEVPQQGRVGKTELRKVDAKALVVSHFIGTPQGLYDVLERGMFKSGYLARQIWVRGVHIPVTEDSIKIARPGEERAVEAFDLLPRYWQSRVLLARRQLTGFANPRPATMHFTDEAAERLDRARWAIVDGLDKLGDPEIFRPIGNRMLDIHMKACALLAMSEGRKLITRNDVVLACEYVQRWLDAAVEVVDGIAASAFSRSCDEIESFIASREGHEAEASRIYSMMRGVRSRDVDEYLDSLVRQGRISMNTPKDGGPRRYRIKGGTA